jgi:hypothetical protein
LTPAQKPRGLARIIFMRVLLGHRYPTGLIAICKSQIADLHTTKPPRASRTQGFSICNLQFAIGN